MLAAAAAAAATAGDWFKVERLVKETGGDNAALANAWNKIGQYYSDRQKWAKAAQYYTQVGFAQPWLLQWSSDKPEHAVQCKALSGHKAAIYTGRYRSSTFMIGASSHAASTQPFALHPFHAGAQHGHAGALLLPAGGLLWPHEADRGAH
jgi:hypothetical protein